MGGALLGYGFADAVAAIVVGGMIIKAVVVLKPGHAGDAAMIKTLQDHVKASIAPYKYPREVAFVTALPRTETGKLQRFRLRQTP